MSACACAAPLLPQAQRQLQTQLEEHGRYIQELLRSVAG